MFPSLAIEVSGVGRLQRLYMPVCTCLYVYIYMRVMFVFVSVCMCVLEIPPLVFYPLPYVMMIAVKISPYIPSMSGGLYTFFKNLPSSPLVRRKHSLLSG